jgi:hypothetical protein
VRLSCIKVVQSLDLVMASILPKSLLVELGERCRDKKVYYMLYFAMSLKCNHQ